MAIEKIGLDYNLISDDGGEALSMALEREATSPKLRLLGISANRLSEPMVQRFYKVAKARSFSVVARPQLSNEKLTAY